MNYSKETAKALAIQNENNKFACKVFSYINFAPPDQVDNNMMDTLFVIDNDGQQIFAKCAKIIPLTFFEISSYDTLLASALEARFWKQEFLKKHPTTTSETAMAIYTFIRYDI